LRRLPMLQRAPDPAGPDPEPGVLRPLSDVPVGHRVNVESLHLDGLLRRRVLDLGFVPGAVVHVVRRSPLGDPTAYMVMGAVVALRAGEAKGIKVR